MSRVMKKGALRRFTAFLLAFCCLFSMAPTAFAADPDDGNDETQYRYVWLISQPGFAIRITQGNGGHRVQVRDMDLNHTPQPWIDCKLIESPTGDGQVYVADGNNMPSDLDNTLGGQRPAAQDGIGYVRLYTNFDRTVLPSSSIPNWEGTSFSYVQNMTRPLDPNRITEENEDIEYWAGNVSGGDSFYVTLGRDSWTQHVDTKGTDPYGKYGEKLDPESEGDVFPSPIRTNAVDQFGEDDTYYYAQVQIPKDIVDAYVLQNGYMGTGSNTDSFLNIGNNTMFQFRSENELPAPELDDIGTVIFDFNLPGEAAEVTYLEKGGTMVDVPGISTKQVQGVTFEFKGWFTEPEGGQQITDPQVEVEAGKYVVYYAQWELTGLDIPPEQMGEGDLFVGYFDYNLPGTGVTAVYCAAGTFEWTVTVDGESKTYTAQLPFQFPEDPYRAGYRFLGWATTPDATAPNVNESWLPTRDDNTVFGVWEEEIYDLTWDANGGQTTTTTEQKYNEEIQPPANEPTREGYTFGGWYLDANCTIPLASGSKVYGDQTFYAKWTSEKVFVNYYDTRQGTALVTTQEYNYGDLLDLLGPLENTDGWTFQHWATQDGTQATEDTPLVNPTVTYHPGGNGSDVSSDAGYWVLDLYAVWGEEHVDFTATVWWDDFQDNDGCRPRSVRLGLVSSINDELIAEKTVQDDGNDRQEVVFEDLPITTADSSVEKITYKLVFLGWTDSDGMYRDIHDTAASSGEIEGSSSSDYDDTVSTVYKYAINNYVTGYAAYIKLDHALITTGDDIKFSIQWEDMSDNDGKRPGAIMLMLFADGLPVHEHPMHNSGTGLESVSPSECTVSEDGDTWTYCFRDYQKYNNGKAINYTVAVMNDDLGGIFNKDGYYTEYLDGSQNVTGHKNGAIISRDIELTDKTVTIRWDDESNRDNQRPESVSVTLTAYQWNRWTFRWEEHMVDTAEITGGTDNDVWSHTFEDIKKYNGGQEIIYEVAITSDLNAHVPEGAYEYTWVANQLVIDISKNRNVKDIPVTIEWDDAQNTDNIRPSTVIVQLHADGQPLEGAEYAKLLSGDMTADTWEYTFEDLPVYREGEEGQEILYTISVEEAVEDSLYGTYISTANGYEEEIVRYTASYMNAAGETTPELSESNYPYAKLTHETDQGSVNIYASWHDEQNVDGKRPTSIQVELYKQVDGERQYLDTYTVTAGDDNSWTYRVEGLPLYEDGNEIIYLVDVSDEFRQNLQDTYGYTISLEGNVVHLYYTPSVGYVTGHINWQDNDNNDNIRPDSVKGTLYANGESTGQTLEFNADNDWTQTWQDVASYYNNNGVTGTPVQYSIVVETPDGYTVTYSPESTTTVDPHDIQINLAHETDQQGLEATIYWNDNSNQDNKRPEQVEVQLYANGEVVVGQKITMTGDGDVWTGNFTGLDIYDGGEKIDYTIRVNDNTVDTYTAMTAGMNLYLSYQPEVADVAVAFRFEDRDNADGVRPEALYVNLTADGVPVDEAEYKRTAYFDVDGMTWTFTNLPVYSTKGEKINYNATVELSEEYGATDYVVTTSKDVELSPTGSLNQIVITLSRDSDVGSETGHIYWFDANNQRGNRPETIDVVVRNDATTAVVGTYTIDSVKKVVTDSKGSIVGGVTVAEWGNDGSSCWEYTIEGLTQNAVYNGVSSEIYYTATASSVGLTAWYNVDDGKSLDIALTHKNYQDDVGASEQDFDITVSWMDNANAWSLRPNTNGVDVKLLANGEEYQTIHLTQQNCDVETNPNAWTYSFEGLPTYLNGNAVVWTAEINDVPMYTETVSNAKDYATITMTQSIGFDFTVNWEDSDDDDAVRPDSVTVDIYGDGSKVGSVELTGEGNTWTGSISDLRVWREVGDTIPVSYSFRWSDETAKLMLDEGYSASATQNGEAVEADTFYWVSATEWGNLEGGLDDLTGQYQWETTVTRNKETKTVYADILWDDDGNRDGLRPEQILVQLYANGQPVGDPTTLTGGSTDSSWPISWTEQDVYDGGEEIVYTVEVVEVPDGYSASSDSTGLNITLYHAPEKVEVTGKVIWDDESEAHYVYNSYGELIDSYYQIERCDVYMQLYLNGEPYGEPVLIREAGYDLGDGKLAPYASYTWMNLFVYQNEGETNEYTFKVYSDDLDALLNDGYTQSYDFDQPYDFSSTISHTYYDVRGTVYYLYDTSDEFLLANVPVTAYLYNEEADTYTAVGSDVTDEFGNYEILNIPQGKLIVRATYQYGDYTYAGSRGANLSLCDANDVDIVVDRDAEADSDLYRYTASGNAYYQTDITDDSTITPVPADSVVLLYKVVDNVDNAQYMAMTTTDENGAYSFGSLEGGTYLVTVAFNFDGGTYTYDNNDAVADGIQFIVSGADVKWPDIVKQVNPDIDPGPEVPDEPDPEPEPEPEPQPCVTDGYVYFSDNGVHTTDPVEGVDVYIYTAEGNVQVGHAVTDENGHWTIEGLAAGNYIGVFSYASNASRVLHFTISDADYEKGTYTAATQYFDRNSDKSTATIRGVVLNEDGNQNSALVQIQNMDGELVDIAYTDASGFYNFTVQSGFTYRVLINEIDSQTEYLTAGDPDDELTELEYYTISGNFAIDGVPQESAIVALYKQDGDNFNLLNATLTNAKGDYTLQAMDAGNYRVTMYVDGEVYDHHYVSVGYQDYMPTVKSVGKAFNITGEQPDGFDSAVLYNVTTDVVNKVAERGSGNNYSFTVTEAGNYRLEFVKDGVTTIYYIDAPNDAVSVDYVVSVSGNVVDDDGNPMLGAVVTLLNSNGEQVGEQTIITDGKFAYNNVPSGNYQVKVDYPVAGEQLLDRTTAETDSYGAIYPDGMTPGSVWSWNINAHTVSGTVKDQTGDPIEGATVVIKPNDDPDKAYGAVTDADGNWSIGVPDGEYTASAMYEFDADHIYHSVADVPVSVNGGDVDNINIVINRYDVTGTVVRDGDDKPLPDAEITILYPDGSTAWEGTSDDEGKFVAPLFPDDYKVIATFEDQSATADITVENDMEVTLKVGMPIIISGTVYDDEGNIVPDGIVYYDGVIRGKVYTDDEGHYTINLTASQTGRYTLYAEAAGKTSAKVTIYVLTDTTQDLTIDGSGETQPSGDRTVSGVVVDNESNRLANAIVTLTYGDDKEKTVTTSTDRNGNFRFEDLLDGTYYLTASYEADNGYTYTTNAETAVHVDGKDVTDIVLAVALSYDVTVKVEDVNGAPVANATVTYTGAGEGEAQTGEDGSVVITVPAGAYNFIASTESRVSDVKAVTVAQDTTVVLVLDAVGIKDEPPTVESTDNTINGYVYDPDGNPVEGADVTLEKWNPVTEAIEPVDNTKSDADGFYEFTDLDDGRYRVNITYDKSETVTTTVSNFVIHGYALDEGGNPYVGATVSLHEKDDPDHIVQTVYTDETGYYEFVNVPSGDYLIEIIPAQDEGATQWTEQTVFPGNAVIEGTVIDVNGDPVNGATVVVTGDNGSGPWTMITGEDGKYSFEVPSDGEYTVTITYPHSFEVTTDGSYENDPSDPLKPSVIGDDYKIYGYVHDMDGNIIEGATVILKDAEGNKLDETLTNEDGYYEFTELDPGEYIVEVIWGDQEKEYDVDTGDNDSHKDPVDPDKQKEFTISGTVYDEEGNTVADATVFYDGVIEGWVNADSNGRYEITIDEDETGTYTLYAESDGNTSKPISVSVLNDTVVNMTIIDGSDVPPVDDDEHTVVVTVQDKTGKPVSNAVVTYDGPENGFQTTDADGKTVLTLDEGEYTFTASIDGRETEPVTVNVDNDKNVTLVVDMGGTVPPVEETNKVTVTVVDEEGKTVAGALVVYTGDKTGSVQTGADGTVVIELPNGSYKLQASFEDSFSEATAVMVDGDESVTLSLDNGSGGEDPNPPVEEEHNVTVTVVDENGDPVEGATIVYTGDDSGFATTGSDGTAVVTVPDGNYDFQASFDGKYTEVVSESVDADTNITLTLVDEGGDEPDPQPPVDIYDVNVSVVYLDGVAAEGADITYTGAVSGSAVSDQIGEAEIQLPFGEYEFQASLNGVSSDTVSATIISDSNVVLTLNANSTDEPVPPVDETFDVTVYVVNNDTEAVANAKVAYTGAANGSADTNADGYAVVTIPAGEYNFQATLDGLASDIQTVTVDGPMEITLTLPDDGGSEEPEPPVTETFNVDVTVVDSTGAAVPGATVLYTGKQAGAASADNSGIANLTLAEGEYTFSATDGERTSDIQSITVDSDKSITLVLNDAENPDPDPDDPDPTPGTIHISGSVVTDHRKPLAGAIIHVTNLDTDETFDITADEDGLFNTGDLESGRYEFVAEYTHEYGSNTSEPFFTATSQDDVVLVIVLKYVEDVNGDGEDETIYAGEDDEFDTPDDWYPADIDGDGDPEIVEAGEDGKPGTPDDHYGYDVDHDGEDETVYVGEDTIPGTEDDWYPADPDQDGEDEPVYAGEDGIPGTEDDWYPSDPDKDGEDEVIHVGEDTQPGTPDDWYEGDPDNDGDNEQIFVGDDTIPGTDDDWYYDDDGNKTPIGDVRIHFNANGGAVNGSSVYTVLQSELNRLPNATRDGYSFDGWFTSANGGTELSLADILAMPITTTVYAHWTESGGSNPGGGGGTGGGGGGGGGGGITPPADDGDYTITIEDTPGADIDPVGEQQVDEGDDLTVTIKPEDGYIIEDVLVDGESIGVVDEYTFEDIDSDHTLEVIVVPEDMLTDEHIAYVGGYPDGSVRPEANITRAEVAMIFYRLLSEDARSMYEASTSDFNDIVHGAWYETAIATLTNAGILDGYPDGSFRPDATITRAEFAAIAARFDKSDISGGASFTDISGHWAQDLIMRASALGWVNGYSDGSFRPDTAITRAEAVTLINRVLDRDTLTHDSLLDGMKTWPDNAESAWYYLAMQEATNGHDCTMENGVEVWTVLK